MAKGCFFYQMGSVNLNIVFPKYPLIYIWIQSDYDKCNSIEECKEFMWECFNTAYETKNVVKREAYYKTACVIYSKLTGRSWESMNNNIEKWVNKKTN